LKLGYHELLSTLAFNFNLRPHTKGTSKTINIPETKVNTGRGRRQTIPAREVTVDLPAGVEEGQRQGFTLVHVRAQLQQLQDTCMSHVGLHGGQKSSS